MKTKNTCYAYALPSGKKGIAADWKACEKLVNGVAGARYRGFGTKSEAEAWLRGGATYEQKPKRPAAMRREPGIYFDAGTGRGKGVEVSVTDEHGKSLLRKNLSARDVNRFGVHRLKDRTATNNFGELLGLKHALQIAPKTGTKKIFGDSKLVIEFWSVWRIKRKELSRATVALADEVSALRELFEASGGEVSRVSGDVNPADLGFHR